MWLDRLGANPPPSGFDSRPISPLPRRVSARAGSPYLTSQQRSARASTSSLVSSPGDSPSGSTTSLLRSSSLRANGTGAGSSLRQSHTVDDGSESLAALRKILGDEAAAAAAAGASGEGEGGVNGDGEREGLATTITEEDLELEVDFGGLSLREFLAREDAAGEEGGGSYRSQTIEECMWAIFLVSCLDLAIPACVGTN